MKPMPTARQILAENLKRIFEARGLSSNKVGKFSGVPQRTIHNMLAQAHDPAIGNVDKLASALGLEAWQLLISEEIERKLQTAERALQEVRAALRSVKEICS
jgi:transcriptional regulator with XRE-family HTH domain